MRKLALLVITIAWTSLAPLSAAIQNAKPFVIPELREWRGDQGQFTPNTKTRIVVSLKNSPAQIIELQKVAVALANDVKTMFGLDFKIEQGAPLANAIFINIAKIPTDNIEGYQITITPKGITIAANSAQGAFWATRSLLQMMECSPERALSAGRATDYPAYAMRGMMLDVGRKFFSIDFLRQYVKFMAYYKMNTFQIHLNDQTFPQFYNDDWDQTPSAFRLESTTFPGLAARDGHYTKTEFRDLQILGEQNFVTIIPEIDAPAHTLAFTEYRPSIGSEKYGMDHLDLFKTETYNFMDSLWKEYIQGPDPVFRGQYVHIGTDEYSNKDQEVVEKFRYFTDHYIKYVESFGKKAMLWGALTHAKGTTPVKVDNVLMSCWFNGYANPDSMMRLGYDVLSVPDGDLYIVPLAGYYYDYLDTKQLYNKWTPANIGNQTFAPDKAQIKGGMFAVWNDHAGNGISSRDVHHRVWPAMQTLSVKLWDGTHASLPYDEFNVRREQLSEAPGVNLLGRMPKGVAFQAKKLVSGASTGLNEVGYDYRVSMNVSASKPITRATILSYNDDAIFYLADPLEGEVGFSRDGYLFTFDYTIPVGKAVHLAVEGDSRSTSLFVDGKLFKKLDITYIKVKHLKHNASRPLIKTLQFPLSNIGNLPSWVEVSSFEVEKL
ncbi:MAG: family 20 glycosylhydrolase [Mucinivorans sp.]